MNNKLQLTNHESRAAIHDPRKMAGSALILAVVLTTLLAIIGVVFLLVARIDKIAASAASENRELSLAVETVIAKISQQLALDVPRIGGREYYDYPDVNNAWLAVLEPYKSGSNYYWPRISDLYYKLGLYSRNLAVEIIPDYPDPIKVGDSNNITIYPADADGDGVGDSTWIKLPDITSGKGKPIYAAIRIVDNGGMINVNTAYKFDPTDPCSGNIDGSSQMQVNLLALAGRDNTHTKPGEKEDRLLGFRCGSEPNDISKYEQNVIWRYGTPNGSYTPFDISDDLELRNRFLINLPDTVTRIENLWTNAFKNLNLRTPVTSDLTDWFYRAQHDMVGPNDIYSYKHLATTYNMDRIIDPNGEKMVNVNTATAGALYSALYSGLRDGILKGIIDPNLPAQLAVNIVDLRDSDANVTVLSPPIAPKTYYYGFEAQPFISEIAFRISGSNPDIPTNNYFAIELYNPFEVPIPLSDFRLELRRPSGGVAKTVNLAGYTIAAKSWFVITNNLNASKDFDVTSLMSSIPPRGTQDPNLVLAIYEQVPNSSPPEYHIKESYDDIFLLRKTSAQDIYLDRSVPISSGFIFENVKGLKQFYYRPDNNWNIVYQEMQKASSGTLGAANGGGTKRNYNIPTFRYGFVTVGDIARVLTVGPSPDPNDMIGARLGKDPPPSEKEIRIDLEDRKFQQIFDYLTVFDPNDPKYGGHPATETRIKGRININTAPWFVLAQLPWVKLRKDNYDSNSLAQAIVAYRDTTAKGFKSIGELMNVTGMDYYYKDGVDLKGFPDLTTLPTGGDGAADDFEERDIIFARISNLVTVRSDVFMAYILVRIGPNGPQKRVVAILDRSGVPTGKVKIIALQPVPDPG